MSQRRQTLALYKKILRIGRNWIAKVDSETEKERIYIREEARNLFRQNRNLNDSQEIQRRIEEGEARLQIALHFCRNSKSALHYDFQEFSFFEKFLGENEQSP